jgi:hypothetical protein
MQLFMALHQFSGSVYLRETVWVIERDKPCSHGFRPVGHVPQSSKAQDLR